MMKMSFTNNQVAFDYVLYMIVGSYFKKTSCIRSKLQEKRMFLQYKEQKLKSQLAMEDACIMFAEEELKQVLPKEIWEEEVEVRIIRRGEEQSFICFDGKGFRLLCTVDFNGKGKAGFAARFYQKKKEIIEVKKELRVKEPKN